MKKTVILMALLLVLTLTAGLLFNQVNSDKLSFDDKQRIQRRFQMFLDDRNFSGAVYSVYHNDVVFDGGRGMATDELENGTDIAYGVASLTKQFTAASIVQLQEKGLLSVNDKLSKYFFDYRYGDEITVKDLLSMRSGIPDYSVESWDDKIIVTCYGCYDRGIVIKNTNTAEKNREKIRSYFLSQELLFEPGEEYDYSDSNFALLAEIVSQVSGMSYHEYVRENIFEPLGMTRSAFIDDYDPEAVSPVAQTDREDFDMDYFTVAGAEYGCGDILTTPRDLYLWYRGLFGGKVVSSYSLREMTTSYSELDELGYGYGLMVSDTSDSKALFHYGYIPSFYSAVIYVPEIDYFQVVLANHGDGDPHVLAADLAKYFGRVIGFKFVDIE